MFIEKKSKSVALRHDVRLSRPGTNTHLFFFVFLASPTVFQGPEVPGRRHTGLAVHKAAVAEAGVREVLGVLELGLWTLRGVQHERAGVGALYRRLVLLLSLPGVLETRTRDMTC